MFFFVLFCFFFLQDVRPLSSLTFTKFFLIFLFFYSFYLPESNQSCSTVLTQWKKFQLIPAEMYITKLFFSGKWDQVKTTDIIQSQPCFNVLLDLGCDKGLPWICIVPTRPWIPQLPSPLIISDFGLVFLSSCLWILVVTGCGFLGLLLKCSSS